jgi:hypothetical protein
MHVTLTQSKCTDLRHEVSVLRCMFMPLDGVFKCHPRFPARHELGRHLSDDATRVVPLARIAGAQACKGRTMYIT